MTNPSDLYAMSQIDWLPVNHSVPKNCKLLLRHNNFLYGGTFSHHIVSKTGKDRFYFIVDGYGVPRVCTQYVPLSYIKQVHSSNTEGFKGSDFKDSKGLDSGSHPVSRQPNPIKTGSEEYVLTPESIIASSDDVLDSWISSPDHSISDKDRQKLVTDADAINLDDADDDDG